MPDPKSPPRSAAMLPRWLKRNVPKGNAGHFTARLVEELRLQTVCDHAHCPNRMECYAAKTATLMILGEVCTRACRFCSVRKGRPGPLDADEPRRVAAAVVALGLAHVVVTCVTRDDLPDGGAEQFVATIAAIRRACRATVEVLPSDFAGNAAAVDRLVAAAPEVYNHNSETVPRLYAAVRGRRADYRWTLAMFRRIARAAPAIQLKTGLMLGLGETTEELLETLAELLDCGLPSADLGAILAAFAGADAGGALPAAGGICPPGRVRPPPGFRPRGRRAAGPLQLSRAGNERAGI